MSVCYGIFSRNGAPVSEALLEAMHGVVTEWFNDDHGTWCEGPAGLGFTALHTTQRSFKESLPRVMGTTGSRKIITGDVRLDNREELANRLGISAYLEETSDSELLLAAYEKWGEDSPRYLLGDFVYVIWDERARTLFCARDHVGIKPFYYMLTDGHFIFCNDIRPLTVLPQFSDRKSEQAVALYLRAGEMVDPELTFFECVKKLPPATTLMVTSERVRRECYWRPEDSPRIKLPSDEAYVEQLTELLKDAVHSRCDAIHPVGAHLSGGLDSSGIVAVATPYLRSKGQRLHTFNWMPPPMNANEASDPEWKSGQQVAAHLGLSHEFTDLKSEDVFDLLLNHEIVYNDTVDLWYEYRVRENAKNKGCCVLLSGWGGDQLVSYGGSGVVADLFWHGRFVRAIRAVWVKPGNVKWSLRRMVGRAYREIMEPFNNTILPKSYRSPYDAGFLFAAKPSISSAAREIDLDDSRKPGISVRRFQIYLYQLGFMQSRLESWATSAVQASLEYRYPLLDKQIVEFALGVPAGLYHSSDAHRALFRRSAVAALPNNLVPEGKLLENARVSILGQLEEAALSYWCDRYDSKPLPESPYVDPKRVRQLIEDVRSMRHSQTYEKTYLTDMAIKSVLALKI